MDYTTMRRSGGWCVELMAPIDGLDKLEIQSPSLDHTIRWARNEIPSVLALLSELTGVKESILRKLSGQDSDRVFVAFSFIVPQQIKQDFDNGSRPLATPVELMTGEQKYEQIDSEVDEVDPRFPKVHGEVKRFRQPEAEIVDNETADTGGIDVSAPDVIKQVG